MRRTSAQLIRRVLGRWIPVLGASFRRKEIQILPSEGLESLHALGRWCQFVRCGGKTDIFLHRLLQLLEFLFEFPTRPRVHVVFAVVQFPVVHPIARVFVAIVRVVAVVLGRRMKFGRVIVCHATGAGTATTRRLLYRITPKVVRVRVIVAFKTAIGLPKRLGTSGYFVVVRRF